MCIHVPKFALRLMGSSSGEKLAKMIENQMLKPTLERFRQLVTHDEEGKASKEQLLQLVHDHYYQRSKLDMANKEERTQGFQPVVPQDN
jgi:hypothetical protein